MKLTNMDGACLGPPWGLYPNEGLLEADGDGVWGVCIAVAEAHREQFQKHLLGAFCEPSSTYWALLGVRLGMG